MDKRATARGDGALDGGEAAGKQAGLALPPAMSTGARRLKRDRPVGLRGVRRLLTDMLIKMWASCWLLALACHGHGRLRSPP